MNDATTSILFLHGINNTGGVWRPVFALLQDTITCLAPTLPALKCVDQISDTLASELGGDYILVGHSFGGYVALAMLERIPERIKGIALINSQSSNDPEPTVARRFDLIDQARSGAYESLAQLSFPLVFHSSNLNNSALMRAREIETERYGAERYINHQYACLSRPDRSDVLRAFCGPKLVIAAEDDLVITAAEQKRMADECGANFAMIGGAGHMLPAESPERVATEIHRWLSKD